MPIDLIVSRDDTLDKFGSLNGNLTNFVFLTTCLSLRFYAKRQINQHIKVKKRAKIRNRYNQAPHLTQDTNGKVTTSQLDITNESQGISPFPAGDHKASINRRARKHNKIEIS